MRRRAMVGGVAWMVASRLAGLGPVAAQEATPPPGSLPEVDAPYGLSGMILPESWEDVREHFRLLPDRVNGLDRNPLTPAGSGRLRVTYGPRDPALGAPLVIQALDFRESDFFPPDFTPGLYVEMVARSDDSGTTAYGRDRDIVWLEAETSAASEGGSTGSPAASRTLHTLAWGAADGPILFTAAATTPEGLAALVESFVAVGEEPHSPMAPDSGTPVGDDPDVTSSDSVTTR